MKHFIFFILSQSTLHTCLWAERESPSSWNHHLHSLRGSNQEPSSCEATALTAAQPHHLNAAVGAERRDEMNPVINTNTGMGDDWLIMRLKAAFRCVYTRWTDADHDATALHSCLFNDTDIFSSFSRRLWLCVTRVQWKFISVNLITNHWTSQ